MGVHARVSERWSDSVLVGSYDSLYTDCLGFVGENHTTRNLLEGRNRRRKITVVVTTRLSLNQCGMTAFNRIKPPVTKE